MTQMRWPDGTVKNVHVDLAELFEYQKQLRDVVSLFEKRVQWLTKESRGYFGTIVEPNVVILVDLSGQNSVYLVHIHYCLRHVLEQQVSQKSTFNLIAFGSSLRAFRPQRVQVNEKNLQAAWDWIRELPCSGSRNVLAAIRIKCKSESALDSIVQFKAKSIKHMETTNPRLNALTTSRQLALQVKQHKAASSVPPKAMAWERGVSNTSGRGDPMDSGLRLSNNTQQNPRKPVCGQRKLCLFAGRCAIPKDEEILSSRDWLQKYSTRNLGLNLNQLVSGAACKHIMAYHNPSKAHVEARYCVGLFPLVNIAGGLRHLQYTWGELEVFRQEEGDIVVSYLQEQRCRCPNLRLHVALYNVDDYDKYTGGSLPGRYANITKTADVLRNNIVFNMIAFNSTITEWQAIGPTVADETACHDAIAWIDQLEAVGGTATEVAIFRARHHLDAVDPHTGLCSGQRNPAWMQNCTTKTGISNMITKAIYLLTDGKPDSSCTSILKAVSDAWKIDPSSMLIKLMRRYIVRFQWLLSGSRRYFGLITERCVVILLDMSGSMISKLDELKTQLKQLVWEQLFR
ncbi:hypothetical protein AHF37_08631 [Paragonimus kellicotti]|nr:hypothetical protein AHF37_08631 [Paragonimus kellicotti]